MQTSAHSLESYLARIALTPLLSAEEERALARRARAGDDDARRQLVEANLRFVVKVARAYQGKGLPLVDLIQEGNLGLMEAVRKFDPDKGYRMTTYASWWIRLYVQRAIDQKAPVVPVPINKLEQIKRITAYCRNYTKVHGKDPDTEQIAGQLGLPPARVEQLMRHRTTTVPLEAGERDDGFALERVLSDDSHERMERGILLSQMRKRLGRAMRVLTAREREVIERRFGLSGDGTVNSLRQIGQVFGLSAEGVRRIEEQALAKLRRPTVLAQMQGFFN